MKHRVCSPGLGLHSVALGWRVWRSLRAATGTRCAYLFGRVFACSLVLKFSSLKAQQVETARLAPACSPAVHLG
jgi:hypothetical protein